MAASKMGNNNNASQRIRVKITNTLNGDINSFASISDAAGFLKCSQQGVSYALAHGNLLRGIYNITLDNK